MLFCTHFRFRMRKESNRIWFYLGDATTRPTFVQRSRPTDTSTIRFVVIRWCVFQLHTFIMNFVGCVCAEIFAIDACKLLPTFFYIYFFFHLFIFASFVVVASLFHIVTGVSVQCCDRRCNVTTWKTTHCYDDVQSKRAIDMRTTK